MADVDLMTIVSAPLASCGSSTNRTRSSCRFLRRGGDLGDGEGWEAVPYAAARGPQGGQRLERWFVHHEFDTLLSVITGAGFVVDRVDTRTTHRAWAMVSAHV